MPCTRSRTTGKASGFAPSPVEQIRNLFPQLEIIELVGKGGMGAVYKARQAGLDRLVALKILPPGAAGDAGFAERFNREARALARLNHPHIVAVHDFGQVGGQPYLVMEFVDGPNLRQAEQAGRLTPSQALEVIPQICEALQFAHSEGIVHRDIKPENMRSSIPRDSEEPREPQVRANGLLGGDPAPVRGRLAPVPAHGPRPHAAR